MSGVTKNVTIAVVVVVVVQIVCTENVAKDRHLDQDAYNPRFAIPASLLSMIDGRT